MSFKINLPSTPSITLEERNMLLHFTALKSFVISHFTWPKLSQVAKIHRKIILSHVLEFQKDKGVAATKK